LKINKVELREIKAKNICVTFYFLSMFQKVKKLKLGLTIEEIIEICNEYMSHFDALREIAKYSSIRKVLNYLTKQYIKFNGTKGNKHYYAKSNVLTNLKDYFESCKKLGVELNRDQVISPKDLHTAHQNANKQIMIQQNADYDIKISGRLKFLEKYKFMSDEYLIRPAESSLELIEEGSTLNHCVATHYTVPYANGETNILFIRKLSEPDKPFCTVEVKNNSVRQAYIKDDRTPDKSTLAFIKLYKEKVLKIMTSSGKAKKKAIKNEQIPA
jgi:hypothetical protein